ncbi:MAG: VOC family protein [Candidatus Thorarchaeota archaeon]
MKQRLLHVAIVVRDYDEALDFFLNKLNFYLIEDTYQPEQDKRWVTIAPTGYDSEHGATVLLARPSKPGQEEFIGNQTGGRVFLFLQTDDFWRDYNLYKERGIKFVRNPKEMDYGTVAVFEDLYGNLWDLIQLKEDY